MQELPLSRRGRAGGHVVEDVMSWLFVAILIGGRSALLLTEGQA